MHACVGWRTRCHSAPVAATLTRNKPGTAAAYCTRLTGVFSCSDVTLTEPIPELRDRRAPRSRTPEGRVLGKRVKIRMVLLASCWPRRGARRWQICFLSRRIRRGFRATSLHARLCTTNVLNFRKYDGPCPGKSSSRDMCTRRSGLGDPFQTSTGSADVGRCIFAVDRSPRAKVIK